MVRDLFHGFVREKWAGRLHYGRLERVSNSFVTDRLRVRTGDIAWRIHMRNRGYLYLLLEFQSTPERNMALRMLTYMGLLLQEQIRAERVSHRRLPEVYPVVIYTGRRRWNAPTTLHALLPELRVLPNRFRPQARYRLIDAQRLHTRAHHLEHNLVALLFRLENSRTRIEMEAVLDSLFATLKRRGCASLNRAFSAWVNQTILTRLPSGSLNKILESREVRAVLTERFAEWEAQWKASGMREGIRQGKVELLLEQLRKRFGALPAEVRERVNHARVNQLSRWGERLLEARSLAQLFPRKRKTVPAARRA